MRLPETSLLSDFVLEVHREIVLFCDQFRELFGREVGLIDVPQHEVLVLPAFHLEIDPYRQEIVFIRASYRPNLVFLG